MFNMASSQEIEKTIKASFPEVIKGTELIKV